MLGHDSHGHAEQTGTGCTGFLQTIAVRRDPRRQRVRHHQRALHRQGRLGRPGAVADRLRAEHHPPEAPGGRVRRQPVRHGDGHQHRHHRCTGVHRSASARATGCSSTARSTCSRPTRRVPLRGCAPAGPHGGLAAGGDRPAPGLDHRPGDRHGQPHVHRRRPHLGDDDGAAHERGERGARAVPDVPHGHGRGDGRATCSTSTGPSSAATASRSSRRAPPATPAARCRATLALSLGTPAAFAPFTPGVANTYTASTTANVISTAGDATLSVADPSTDGDRAPGQRGVLAAVGAAGEGVQRARHRRGVRRRRRLGRPTTLLTYAAPVSNDAVAVAFQQAIGANDALRTGAYSKTLTFTLSTTTP